MTELDLLIENAAEVFLGDEQPPLNNGTIGVHNGHVVYLSEGPFRDGEYRTGAHTQHYDARSQLVTPGLVDPHTHVVFGGERSHEYAMRAGGRSYLEIAKAGGGILSTVKSTRAATLEELVESALPRLDQLLQAGVTTVEVKSGYGLSIDSEIKILKAIQLCKAQHPIELVSTFLGAHTIPPEYADDREAYVRLVIEEMIPKVARAGLAEFCDVFVEESAFTVEEGERILNAGKRHGLHPKLHADQLSPGAGAELAGRVSATSADHLEFISLAGIQSLVQNDVVAVLLPGASLFLGSNDDAPARQMLDAGVEVALATDCNPGTCMTTNLQLMLTLGMSRLKMSPAEVLRAVTHTAAKAVGRAESSGLIKIGRVADIAVFDVPSHVQLPYHFGTQHTRAVFKNGEQVYSAL